MNKKLFNCCSKGHLKDTFCSECCALQCVLCNRQNNNRTCDRHFNTRSFSSELLKEYEFINFLGKGSWGFVFKVCHWSNNYYSIKIFDKMDGGKILSLNRKQMIHFELTHPNIITLINTKFLDGPHNQYGPLVKNNL